MSGDGVVRARGARVAEFLALAVLVIACLLVFGVGAAGAAITNVYCPPTGSDNLQTKINSAGSGDTLVIHGTCSGNFSISNKNLTLQGVSGAALDGMASGTTLSVSATSSHTDWVKTLTIRNGSANVGGGIHADGSGSVYLTLNLVSTTVSGNRTSSGGFGGGLYSISAIVNLTDSTVSGNTATNGDGGGFFPDVGSIVSVSNSIVSGNSAYTGGGIYQYAGNLSLTGSTVSGNTSSFGGAGGIRSGFSTLSVTNSTISGNSTAGSGGGILGFFSDLQLTGSTVTYNTATYGSGGGFAIEGRCGFSSACGSLPSGTNLTDSTVAHNTTTHGSGGGIWNDSLPADSPVTIQNSTIANNVAKSGNGGGIANIGDNGHTASLTLTSSTLAGNHATSGWGGAIYNANGYFTSSGTATVSLGGTNLGPRPNVLNDRNQAKYGGGIANDGAKGPASTSLQSGSSVFDNWASVDGGGAYNANGGTLLIGAGATVTSNHPDNVS